MPISIKPAYKGRTIFEEEKLGVGLVVPGPVEDRMIRQGLYVGRSMAGAYGYAGALGAFPVPPLVPCCEAVLRATRFNPATGLYVFETWQFTYDEFYKCLDEYVRPLVIFPDIPGRMEIAPGVYSPNATEELCIKGAFHEFGDIANAYQTCGAADIFPKWAGAAEIMATALTAKPAAAMYDIVMTAYMMKPPPVHHDAPAPDDKKDNTTMIWAAAGAVIAFILLR